MGKVALLFATGVVLSLSGIYMTRLQTSNQSTVVLSQYEEGVIARELAYSAFNVVVSRVAKDFTEYRVDELGIAKDGGEMMFSAEGANEGPVSLYAYGTIGNAAHYLQATMERTSPGWLDAITVDGPVASVTARGHSFLISGIDTVPVDNNGILCLLGVVCPEEEDPEGADASGNLDAHAIRTTLVSASAEFDDAIDADQAVGLYGDGDIVQGTSLVDLDNLETALRSYDEAIVLEGNQRITGHDVYGSREAPVVLIVNGDLDVWGRVEGYGALVVSGDLVMRGRARWEGIVLVSTDGGDHQFRGTVDIFGALIMRSLTSDGESGGEEDAGMPGGHFDIDVFSGSDSLAYHEHQYDDKFDVTRIAVTQSGCATAGGLCWEQLVATGETNRVRIEFVNSGALEGDFVFESSEALVEGAVADGFDMEADVADILRLEITPTSACGIAGILPGSVWSDDTTRGGAFTVRVLDVDSVPSGGNEVLLQETTVYRHSEYSDCDEGDELVDVAPLTFYINGNVGIHLSSTAVERLGDLVPFAAPAEAEIRMTSITEKAIRQTGLAM